MKVANGENLILVLIKTHLIYISEKSLISEEEGLIAPSMIMGNGDGLAFSFQ